MKDSLAKLLINLEPKISNIQENRLEVKTLGDVYQTMSEIVDVGKDNCLDILDFYDQDFIIRSIKISRKNVDEQIKKYNSSRYLLKNRDASFKEMPQYQESLSYIKTLFDYLTNLYGDIEIEYQTKKNNLEIQELLNKYYLLLKRNNILIENPEEFLHFLDLADISNIDKLEILVLINKCNIKNYLTTNDLLLTNDITLSDITNLLEKYKDLIYHETNNDINLELDIKFLFLEYGLSVLNLKKKYLLNKIDKLYQERKYDEIVKYYQDFEEILVLENEFNKQNSSFDLNEKLLFLMDKDKSFVRKYLESCNIKYRSCIYKNLLDIENSKELVFPNYKYNNKFFYIKDEFVVKTVYMYLENGNILIIGVLDIGDDIEKFIKLYEEILNKSLVENRNLDTKERDLLLSDIKLEDLVLTIDLEALDMKMEDFNAR